MTDAGRANGSDGVPVGDQWAAAEIEAIYSTTDTAIALLDRDLRVIRASPAAARFYGREVADVIGHKLEDIIEPGNREAVENMRRVLLFGMRLHNSEVMRVGDGVTRWFDAEWTPVRHQGRVVGVVVRAIDVTERRERTLLLNHVVRELQHRVKNTLTNVLALVENARRSGKPKREVLDTLTRRITALALTHGRLTEANWQATPLAALFEQELVGVYGAERVSVAGPPVMLDAQPALALSIAVHELGTNSLRYGALGAAGGRLDVTWRVDGERLQIVLTERGGRRPRPISAPGFGWRLIEASVQNSLRGRIDPVVMADGYRFTIDLPMVALTPARPA